MNPVAKKGPAFKSVSALNNTYFEYGNDSKKMKGPDGIVIASKHAADDRSASSAMTASHYSLKQGMMGGS